MRGCVRHPEAVGRMNHPAGSCIKIRGVRAGVERDPGGPSNASWRKIEAHSRRLCPIIWGTSPQLEAPVEVSDQPCMAEAGD